MSSTSPDDGVVLFPADSAPQNGALAHPTDIERDKGKDGSSSTTRTTIVGRLKPRSKSGNKSRSQPIPTVTLLSLPDELLSRILNLLHASYQRDRPGVPPIAALLVSKRITAIANRIWLRDLVGPAELYHYRNDAYFAGILSRLETSVYTQEIDLSLGGVYFHLPLAVVARLFALRKLAIHSPPGPAVVPSMRAAWIHLVEHLPALSNLELPAIDEPLSRAISAVAKEREFCLRGEWQAFDPALRLSNVSGHIVRGSASPCSLAWHSAKRIELSTNEFNLDTAWAIIGDLEHLEEQAVPLPLKILKVDLDNITKPIEYYTNLAGWFFIRLFDCLRNARLKELALFTYLPSYQDPLPPMPSIIVLRIGRFYELRNDSNFAQICGFLKAFPNLDELTLDTLYYHASATSPAAALSDRARFTKLIESTEVERIASFPFLPALIAFLVPTKVRVVHVCDIVLPNRQLRYARAIASSTQMFEAQAWSVE